MRLARYSNADEWIYYGSRIFASLSSCRAHHHIKARAALRLSIRQLSIPFSLILFVCQPANKYRSSSTNGRRTQRLARGVPRHTDGEQMGKLSGKSAAIYTTGFHNEAEQHSNVLLFRNSWPATRHRLTFLLLVLYRVSKR